MAPTTQPRQPGNYNSRKPSPVDVEKCEELLGVGQAGLGDGEHGGGLHSEGLQGRVPGLHQLGEEALHTATAANARHQLGQGAEHLPGRHHHGRVQVLLLQLGVVLEHKTHKTHCLLPVSRRLALCGKKGWNRWRGGSWDIVSFR